MNFTTMSLFYQILFTMIPVYESRYKHDQWVKAFHDLMKYPLAGTALNLEGDPAMLAYEFLTYAFESSAKPTWLQQLDNGPGAIA